jgi:hypothetical protein
MVLTTAILSGFPRLFYPFRGFWNCLSYLYFEIYNGEKKEATYKNSRITNLEINEGNVENMTALSPRPLGDRKRA